MTIKKSILLLHTRDDANELASQGYTGDWSLNATRAIGCEYVIICHLTKEDSTGIPNGTGLLIGKIKGLMRSDIEPSRYEVHMSEVADIQIEGIWNRKSQNPVGYTSNFEIEEKGINLDLLEYRKVNI